MDTHDYRPDYNQTILADRITTIYYDPAIFRDELGEFWHREGLCRAPKVAVPSGRVCNAKLWLRRIVRATHGKGIMLLPRTHRGNTSARSEVARRMRPLRLSRLAPQPGDSSACLATVTAGTLAKRFHSRRFREPAPIAD